MAEAKNKIEKKVCSQTKKKKKCWSNLNVKNVNYLKVISNKLK